MANEKRLIDANALLEKHVCYVHGEYGGCKLPAVFVPYIKGAPTVDAIPIAVIKREIAGIYAADQCDQAVRYDYELRNALQTVLEWYDSPLYKETERRTT